MVYNKHEWQDNELITATNLNRIEQILDFINSSVNVKDFGALGDGVTDDTSYFLSAINTANNTGKAVFVPNGTYLITQELVLNGIYLFGENVSKTTIVSKAKYAISLNYQAGIKNISININDSDSTAINFGSRNADETISQNGDTSNVDNVIIYANTNNSIGILMEPVDVNTTGNIHVYNCNITNLTMYHIGTAIKINSRNYGYINSNSFRNITVRGYILNGIVLDSGGSNPRDIQHNVFDNIQLEAMTYSADDSSAILIKAGKFNIFDKVLVFNDSAKDIASVKTGSSIGYPALDKINNNKIINSKMESSPQISKEFMGLNYIDFINISSINKVANGFNPQTHWISKLKPIMPTDMVTNFVNSRGIPLLGVYGSSDYTVGVDEKGEFISWLGANPRYMLIGLTKKAQQEVFTSKIMSVHIKISIDDVSLITAQNLTIDYFDSSSTETWRSPFVYYSQDLGNGDYIITAFYKLTDTDIANAVNFGVRFAPLTTDKTIKVRDVKITANWTMDYQDIEKRNSKDYSKLSTSTPTSFNEMGVFYPSVAGVVWDPSVFEIKDIYGKKQISSELVIY